LALANKMSLDIVAAQALWNEAKAILRLKLGERRYSLWFKRSKIVRAEGNRFTIGLPNAFIVTMVSDRLQGEIKEALKSLVGNDVTLEFVVEPQLFQEYRKSESSVFEAYKQNEDWGQEYSLPIDNRFSLNNFAYGEANKLAYDCANRTVTSPCSCGNPLVFYGPPGTGKTHIILSIANGLLEKNPSLRIMYTTPSAFSDNFIRVMRNEDYVRFRQAMRTCDVFILDNADSLVEKEKLHDEFLYTIEQHLLSESQIIAAFTKHPEVALADKKRLRVRFLCGMLVRMNPPDKAARKQIAQQVFDRLPPTAKMLLAPEASEFIALHFRGTAQSVLSAARQVAAYITIEAVEHNEFVSVDKIDSLLAGPIKSQSEQSLLSSLCEILAERFNISEEELRSGSRRRHLSLPRNLFFYIAKRISKLSFSELGRFINRTHAAAFSGFKQIEKEYTKNPQIASLVDEILGKLT